MRSSLSLILAMALAAPGAAMARNAYDADLHITGNVVGDCAEPGGSKCRTTVGMDTRNADRPWRLGIAAGSLGIVRLVRHRHAQRTHGQFRTFG